jgi:hypothetical protein
VLCARLCLWQSLLLWAGDVAWSERFAGRVGMEGNVGICKDLRREWRPGGVRARAWAGGRGRSGSAGQAWRGTDISVIVVGPGPHAWASPAWRGTDISVLLLVQGLTRRFCGAGVCFVREGSVDLAGGLPT